MPLRLSDVAAKAGVSLTTASSALSGRGRVSKVMAARIVAVAREIGYRPDPVAQALAWSERGNRPEAFHGTMGLLLNSHAAEDLRFRRAHPRATWFDAFPETARELGYQLDIFDLPKSRTEAAALNRILQARGVRGLVVDAGRLPLPPFAPDWSSYATVVVSPSNEDCGFHAISSERSGDVSIALQKCHACGFQRPGLIGDDHRMLEMLTSFEVGCRELKIRRSVPPLKLSLWKEKAFLAWYERWQPDVIIANQGSLPVAALAARGKLAGKDWAYCCLDINSTGEKLVLPLTGFEQMRRVRNRLAVEMVNRALRRQELGPPDAPLFIQIAPRWHEGSTLRSPAGPRKATASRSVGSTTG